MTDYTPTTEEVRCAYIADFGWHAHDSGADFDRWYAEVIRKAKAEAWEEGAAAAWFESGVLQYGDDYPRDNPSWLPFSIRKTNPYKEQP